MLAVPPPVPRTVEQLALELPVDALLDVLEAQAAQQVCVSVAAVFNWCLPRLPAKQLRITQPKLRCGRRTLPFARTTRVVRWQAWCLRSTAGTAVPAQAWAQRTKTVAAWVAEAGEGAWS